MVRPRGVREGGTMTAVPAAYGSWASPLTAALVSESEVRLSGVSAVGDRVYWVESRPAEGRQVLVLQEPNGERVDITPPPFQVRSRVHEYGGGDYLVDGTTIWFSNWADQRLWRQELDGCPVPITPPPPADSCLRYSDGRLSRNRRWLICVRERHEDGAVQNELVAVPADGRGDARLLASGHDFFASPRPSPDGDRLA
ncbi:MAG: S9 family peptidase, partial [Acidimicrobiia bacterium]